MNEILWEIDRHKKYSLSLYSAFSLLNTWARGRWIAIHEQVEKAKNI